jgi:hypothetical protein
MVNARVGTITAVVAAIGAAATLTACGGGAGSTATSTVTKTVQQPSTNPAKAESWPMPDETGKDLQTAQDDLQALTGNPAFISTSKDLTGQARRQINDRNWQVCNSTPAPGENFTRQTNVVFGVVKNTETCP